MEFRDVFHESADGVRLYARDYPGEGATPLLCLPGLTRNSKDFELIASRLAGRRRVVCPDFRGRGRSHHAPDPASYRPSVELADTLALLDLLNIAKVGVIGTSRGGLVAMVMAAQAPARLAGILFNDIGPRLERDGLLRIRSYAGRDPAFADWPQAVAALMATNWGFTGLSEAQWLAYARRVFRDENGRPVPDCDPAIAESLPSVEDIEQGKVQDLWPLYEACAAVPVTILRGANSDLLSAETVAEMLRRHPDAEAVTVPGRGHVPFLDEPQSRHAIARFLTRIG